MLSLFSANYLYNFIKQQLLAKYKITNEDYPEILRISQYNDDTLRLHVHFFSFRALGGAHFVTPIIYKLFCGDCLEMTLGAWRFEVLNLDFEISSFP